MRWPGERALWGVIVAGVVARLVIAALTKGLPYDVDSFELVRGALNLAPLHVYSIVNPGDTFHWPYPPGFLPWVVASGWLNDLTGVGLSRLVRLPTILADAALAWLVWEGLAGRVGDRDRLLAASIVMFGPVMVVISGYAVQVDSVAILPAVIALLVWERAPADRRALIAGGLIGVGASIKSVPLLMVLALAPTARGWREAATLAGAAAAVLLASFVPFALADHSGVRHALHYHGVPGLGGLSLALQPGLAQSWLTHLVPESSLTRWLFLEHAGVDNALAIGGFALYAWRYRPSPRVAAALLWLVVLAFGSGFFFQYVVWGIPFFLLAGYLRATAAMQAVIAAPMLIFYLGPWHAGSIVYVFVAAMLVAWAGWVAGVAVLARRGVAARVARGFGV